MRSIKFPKMFNGNSTNVWNTSEYKEATSQNARLTWATNRGELLGDPYFGVTLKRYLFDQNNYILRDAIIDIIYTQLALFVPQVRVKRDDINIEQDKQKGVLTCTFSGIRQIDYTFNTYRLVLFEDQEWKE